MYEKETGVKELMKMMGLPAWMHWVRYPGVANTYFLSCLVA